MEIKLTNFKSATEPETTFLGVKISMLEIATAELVLREVVKVIAEKYVAEHYAEIAKGIDFSTISKMAELRIVQGMTREESNDLASYSGIPRLTLHQRDLINIGLCPFCERPIKGWKPLTGAFAPEWWATQKEHGIDAASGHTESCPHKKIRL